MLGNFSEKLEAKSPSTAIGCSLQRISLLGDVFSGILPVDASPVEGQQLQQKEVRYQIV